MLQAIDKAKSGSRIGWHLLIATCILTQLSISPDMVQSAYAHSTGKTAGERGVAKAVSNKNATVAASNGWNIFFDCMAQGKCKATVTAKNAKLDTGVFQTYLAGPDYGRIRLVNPGNNSYFDESIDGWISHYRTQKLLYWVKRSRKRFLKRERMCGLQCRKYQMLDDHGAAWGEFWVTQDVRLDPKLETALCRLTLVPPGYGLPMAMNLLSRSGKVQTVALKMLDVKETTVPTRTFEIPKSFGRVKNLADIWLARDGALKPGDIDDFFEKKGNTFSVK